LTEEEEEAVINEEIEAIWAGDMEKVERLTRKRARARREVPRKQSQAGLDFQRSEKGKEYHRRWMRNFRERRRKEGYTWRSNYTKKEG
jgi:hypothetical protein